MAQIVAPSSFQNIVALRPHPVKKFSILAMKTSLVASLVGGSALASCAAFSSAQILSKQIFFGPSPMPFLGFGLGFAGAAIATCYSAHNQHMFAYTKTNFSDMGFFALRQTTLIALSGLVSGMLSAGSEVFYTDFIS